MPGHLRRATDFRSCFAMEFLEKFWQCPMYEIAYDVMLK